MHRQARRCAMLGVLLLLVLGLPGAAHASAIPITFTLDTISLKLEPGGDDVIVGTIEYSGSEDLYLNSIAITLSAPDATYDDSPFFTNFPAIMTVADSPLQGALFRIFVSSTATPGVYSGSVSIVGGLTETASDPIADVLGTQDFQLEIGTRDATPVPEPATLTLFGVALAGLVARRRSRH